MEKPINNTPSNLRYDRFKTHVSNLTFNCLSSCTKYKGLYVYRWRLYEIINLYNITVTFTTKVDWYIVLLPQPMTVLSRNVIGGEPIRRVSDTIQSRDVMENVRTILLETHALMQDRIDSI